MTTIKKLFFTPAGFVAGAEEEAESLDAAAQRTARNLHDDQLATIIKMSSGNTAVIPHAMLQETLVVLYEVGNEEMDLPNNVSNLFGGRREMFDVDEPLED